MSHRQIPELDGIRGAAIIMVVLFHYFAAPMPLASNALAQSAQIVIRPFLMSGVDLFFVLSGFLIGGILLDQKETEGRFRRFWTRRVARILPAYLVATLSFYALMRVIAPGPSWMTAWLAREPYALSTYLTFVQNFAMAQSGDVFRHVWLAPSWSLAVEEQFYLLFPFLVFFLSRRALVILAALSIPFALAARMEVTALMNPYASYVLLPCRIDTLMCGVLAACIIRNQRALDTARRWRPGLDAGIVAMAVVVALQANAQGPFYPLRFTFLAVLWGLVVLRIFLVDGGSYRSALRGRVIGLIGLISYGVYLYHEPVNGLLHGVIFGAIPRANSWQTLAVSALSVVVTLAVAAASFILIENPIRRFASRHSRAVS